MCGLTPQTIVRHGCYFSQSQLKKGRVKGYNDPTVTDLLTRNTAVYKLIAFFSTSSEQRLTEGAPATKVMMTEKWNENFTQQAG